jgi:hypothetical protein
MLTAIENKSSSCFAKGSPFIVHQVCQIKINGFGRDFDLLRHDFSAKFPGEKLC